MTAAAHKVLLVDDNPLFLKLLDRAFTIAGFECITVQSATEALVSLQQHTPDAILSDYEMPGMNGLEFRRFLLHDEQLKNIPFVFLTGNDDQKLMNTGLGMQAVDYVVKDTPVNVVVAKISNLLSTVNKQRELSEIEIKKAATALNIKSVPDCAPALQQVGIDFWHKSYHDIPGGDFIDFIDAGGRYTYVVLGDIMGKKWSAWFFTFSYLSYIRAAVRFSQLGNEYSTAVILQKLNYLVSQDDLLKDVLCSVSLIRIDAQTGQIAYAGAGDLPLLQYSAQSGQLSPVSSNGLLLGLLSDGYYNEQEIDLQKGDSLFVFTDGMIDFAADGGSKSDYNLFARQLNNKLEQGQTFTDIKLNMEKQAFTLVDDCSIIQLKK